MGSYGENENYIWCSASTNKKNPPPNYRLRDNSTGGTTLRSMNDLRKLSHTQIAECGWDCQLIRSLALSFSNILFSCWLLKVVMHMYCIHPIHPAMEMMV